MADIETIYEGSEGCGRSTGPVVVPNALADVILLVGVDDNTGLTPILGSGQNVSVYNALYQLKYEAQVLSALSATDMVNFFPFPHRVDSYPPCCRPDTSVVDEHAEEMMKQRKISDVTHGSHRYASFQSHKTQDRSPKRPTRSNSVNPKMMLGRSMSVTSRRPARKSVLNTIPDLPVSDEVINSISSFCFPDGLKVYECKPESTTHTFVLTNMSGGRSYATCLTFYTPFSVAKDDQDNVYISLDFTERKNVDDGSLRCYVPQCCVIISKFPYYTTVKECLSSMLSYIEEDPEEMVVFLKKYANIITHTPVPPAGNLAVKFNLDNLPVILMPPTHPEKPVIDIPLHLIFLCFNAEDFLKILSCVLMEERIVFLSSNYALLTIVMESVMNLILPFKWRFTYSTILPSAALGYVESVGTFMYGVHSRHKEEVEWVEGLILVDIDEGTVQIPEPEVDNTQSTQNGVSHKSLVPDIPSEMAAIFRNKWSRLKLQFDLVETRRPFCYNMERQRENQTQRIWAQNAFISNTCLELMVNLFRDVVYKLRPEINHFDKIQFLDEHASDRDFYEKVFRTDMFKIFLRERIKGKTDYWSDLEMKSRGFGHSKSNLYFRPKPRRYTLSQVIPSDKREITVFRLKEISELTSHVKNMIKHITKAIEASDDYDDRTSLRYLRALYQYGDGSNMAAMKDFINLSTANSRLLPTKVLSDLYNRFSEEEKSVFKKCPGHELILDCIETNMNLEGERQRIRMDPVAVPDTDLNYFKFEEFVSLRQWSNDYRTIRKLFEALTQERMTSTTELKQITLELFVYCYEDNQHQCSQVILEDHRLFEDETVLKISTLIKTDFGLGRIVLTDKRLFFLSDVSNHYKEIVKLREIRHLEQSEYSSLFSKVSTLKIHKREKGSSPFTAYLKDDRNWWYLVIREMWSGKVVAAAMKDVMMVQHAIQNTLLIDAIIASGQQECTSHYNNTEGAAEMLSYFSTMKQTGKHKLTKDTKDALRSKIDVNIGERESKTVQALLYTGGDEHISPRLWCGLRDGRIKVYNAITWTLESEILVDPKQCVACLTAVTDHVWAGAFGIYIIDSLTLTCTKTLLDHKDLVVDIVLQDNDRFVYTASLDGTIIHWNSQTLTHAKEKIQLRNIISLRSLQIHKERLVCGSWSNIVICDLDGSVINTLEVKDNEKLLELDSFTVASNGEVWAGSRRDGKVHIWDFDTGEYKQVLSLSDCKGISSMQEVDGRIWMGTKDGIIYIYTIADRMVWKQLEGHNDAVRVLCNVRDRYMISGGGSKDGRVCIWNATARSLDNITLIDSSGEHYQ